jgi:hypothetical protein
MICLLCKMMGVLFCLFSIFFPPRLCAYSKKLYLRSLSRMFISGNIPRDLSMTHLLYALIVFFLGILLTFSLCLFIQGLCPVDAYSGEYALAFLNTPSLQRSIILLGCLSLSVSLESSLSDLIVRH